MARRSDQIAPPWGAPRRAIFVLALTLALAWPALVNRSPFFYSDTLVYIRDGDVAIGKLLGWSFATEWTRIDDGARPLADAGNNAAPAKTRRSYDDDEVVGGRSIYYALFANLGDRIGRGWSTVFIQAAAVASVLVLMAEAAGLPLVLGSVIASVIAFSSAPFVASAIMPDMWAGVALLCAAALAAFWPRLGSVSKAMLAALLAYAALVHSTIPLLLLTLGAALAALSLRLKSRRRDLLRGAAVCAGAGVFALAGLSAFNLAIKHMVGKPPISPPFLTARVIEDGPGAAYVKIRCARRPFQICKYAGRLPMSADDVLWGLKPEASVFSTAGRTSRRALSDQDLPFAAAVFFAFPVSEGAAAARNAIAQVFSFSLDHANYTEKAKDMFRDKMPPPHFAMVQRSLSFKGAWPIAPLDVIQYAVSALSTALALAIFVRGRAAPEAAQQASLQTLCLMIYLGVLLNAAICGAFSMVDSRYGARIMWTMAFANLLVIASSLDVASELKRHIMAPALKRGPRIR